MLPLALAEPADQHERERLRAGAECVGGLLAGVEHRFRADAVVDDMNARPLCPREQRPADGVRHAHGGVGRQEPEAVHLAAEVGQQVVILSAELAEVPDVRQAEVGGRHRPDVEHGRVRVDEVGAPLAEPAGDRPQVSQVAVRPVGRRFGVTQRRHPPLERQHGGRHPAGGQGVDQVAVVRANHTRFDAVRLQPVDEGEQRQVRPVQLGVVGEERDADRRSDSHVRSE